MLIRDGRISEAQLQGAIDQQQRVGGRIGTIMVEMGLVDVDTLTVYLGLELGIPIATGATLDALKWPPTKDDLDSIGRTALDWGRRLLEQDPN